MAALVLMVAAATQASSGALRVPSFLASHMMLQRGDEGANLWGWATPGASVSVKATDTGGVQFATGSAVSGGDGRWQALISGSNGGLPARDTSTVVITSGADKITLTDVAFGDVFLCSGQVRLCAYSMPFVMQLHVLHVHARGHARNHPPCMTLCRRMWQSVARVPF
jgi:hypothetical protein